MTVSCEETTEEISCPTKESKNRRTLSESDVNRQKNVEKSAYPPAASAPSRNPMSNTNISSSRNVTEDFQQKRSHSLPHRYKIPHPNMAMISGARGSYYFYFSNILSVCYIFLKKTFFPKPLIYYSYLFGFFKFNFRERHTHKTKVS